MALQDFIKLERRLPDGLEIHVVCRKAPSFLMQLTPRLSRDGKVRGGTIKRVCIPNCRLGDYQRYTALIAEAERFFLKSLEEENHEGREFPGSFISDV